MKSDKELLELAARAVGMNVRREGERPGHGERYWFFNQVGDNPPALYDAGSPSLAMWAPLTDSGDNHRLMVDLRISVQNIFDSYVLAEKGVCVSSQPRGIDDQAATRRAVVEVAAMIGEKKK